jgi:hypothetical protein
MPNSTIMPRPPRQRPGPPLSGASARRWMTSGEVDSTISAGTPRMVDGNWVALRPSFVGRAPMPPPVAMNSLKV